MNSQTGILGPVPKHARYMMFTYEANAADVVSALEPLLEIVDGEETIVGLGPSLVHAANKKIPGLRPFPALTGPGFDIPSSQYALWFWLRGEDPGELFHRGRTIEHALALDFELKEVIDSFMYGESQDLSGYIDGTENPQGDAALQAAVVQGKGEGMDGSSFVAVQTWQHDFDVLDAMNTAEKDNTIGRHVSDNEEFDSAPESAHVKRAAQESYDPEAYILRRSMPWAEGMQAGLVFIAFGKSFDAFEAILHRMLGLEDGIHDALFNITRPLTGAYYWCPPMKGEQLDLTQLGL